MIHLRILVLIYNAHLSQWNSILHSSESKFDEMIYSFVFLGTEQFQRKISLWIDVCKEGDSDCSSWVEIFCLTIFFLPISARIGWTDDIDFDLNGDLTNNSYLNKYVTLFYRCFYQHYVRVCRLFLYACMGSKIKTQNFIATQLWFYLI